MAPRRVIIDCDPGIDDAVALWLALGAPEAIRLEAVTTVAGNVGLAATERNARRVLALAGRGDVPVHAGCPRPLMLPEGRLATVHGKDGLGDVGLPEAGFAGASGHAVEVLAERALAAPGEITLCVLGPMTNLALAIVKRPEVATAFREILFMGGAAFRPGNVTPAAEFNIAVDPHAAAIVLGSGARLTMFGLDASAHAAITEPRLAQVAAAGRVGAVAARLMALYGGGDPCLHDPCVIGALIAPALFDGVEAHVAVECESPLTRGQTVAAVSARQRAGRAANCRVITQVAGDRLFALLAERLAGL
jgi:purine nucleosidase